MATMRPNLGEEQLKALRSQAEAKFYRACRDQLPDDVLVIHSASWIYRDRLGRLREGEADFTLVFPNAGLLTVEVKGGGVATNAVTGQWTSTGRDGSTFDIKDPFRQAQSEKYAILDQVKGHATWRRWPGQRVISGHAVVFPDLHDIRSLAHANRPLDIIGGKPDLDDLPAWTAKVNAFWRTDDTQDLGTGGVTLVENILCSSVEVRAILRSELEYAEAELVRLTERQARILRIIGGRKRAVIAGGAGTGKTLIAIEKARQLAAAGQKVLLLCYNRPLADAIAHSLTSIPTLTVMSFHQLCERRIDMARQLAGRDFLAEAAEAYPGTTSKHKFDVQMPFALALANESFPNDAYDSVIVDEAQDFSDEYWFGVETLLKDPTEGAFYLFTDQNQAIYKRKGELPVKEEPFYLTSNCRNTAPIHALAYGFYQGAAVDVPELAGPRVEIARLESDAEQASAIDTRLRHLLTQEKVAASDIVILLAKRPKNALFAALSRNRLPGATTWSFEQRSQGSVLVDTVARFKGLEAPVIILWLGDEIVAAEERETLYVGTSRAKYLLYVVGSSLACSVLRE